MLKRFLQSAPMQAALAWMAGCYLHFVAKTNRWEIEGAQELTRWGAGGPAIVAFWHECLPSFLPAICLQGRRHGWTRKAVVLASQHRDGRLIGMAAGYFGLGMVLGSSSAGGAEALRGLARALKAGEDVGITPDGPRGPRRQAAAGMAQLAAIAGVPIMPAAAWTSRAIVINSWDRMRIPLPFGRARMVCGTMITLPRHGWAEALPAIELALNAALERAETP